MQYVEKEKKIETSFKNQSRQAKIMANGKAFKMLSGSYSDSIFAIIRELSCNAYDAHVDAGKAEVPFEIYLPTKEEPEFRIVDFGTGMSEEKIMNLYFTYFDSDKTDTNEAVGMLGLGSKSPFSYTNVFNVESRYDNMVKLYACYLNDNGLPSITKVTEREMKEKEENGISISFPVDTSNIHDFSWKLRYVARPFKVKPIIKRKSNENMVFSEYGNYDIALQGKDWILVSKAISNNGFDSSVIAVQGNIEYNINLQLLRSNINNIDENKISKNEKDIAFKAIEFLNDKNVVIEYPIGSFDFTISREQISYDNNSILNLIKKIITVYNDIQEKLEKSIINKNTFIEKAVQYKKLSKIFKGARVIIFNDLYELIPNIPEKTDIELLNLTKTINNTFLVKKSGFNKNTATRYLDDNTVYIYYDEENKKSGIYRLKQHIKEYGFAACVIYSKKDLKFLGVPNDKLKYISEYGYIRKPGRKSSESLQSIDNRKMFRPLKIKKNECFESFPKLSKEELKLNGYLDKKKLYFTRRYNKYQSPVKGKEKLIYLRSGVDFLFKLGYIKEKDYIFEVDRYMIKLKKFREDPNWISIGDFIKEKLEEEFKNNFDYYSFIYNMNVLKKGVNDDLYNMIKYNPEFKEISTLFNEYYNVFKKLEEDGNIGYSNIANIFIDLYYNFYNIDLKNKMKSSQDSIKTNFPIIDITNEIFEKYPMMKFMNYIDIAYLKDDKKEILINYIKEKENNLH